MNNIPSDNTIIVRHWEGDVIYFVAKTKYTIEKIDQKYYLSIEVESAVPSADNRWDCLQKIYLTVFHIPVKTYKFDELLPLEIDYNYNRKADLNRSSFYCVVYLSAHHPVESMNLSIKNNGSMTISAITEDLCYYDGRAKDNKLEVNVSRLEPGKIKIGY